MQHHDRDITGYLTALGFAEYEARVYVALLGHGPLSGYGVSKLSGVPRANVYQALKKLEERDAITVLSAHRGARYAARPSAEFLEQLRQSFEARLQTAGAALQRLGEADSEPVALAVAGQDELLARASALINAATERVTLGVAPTTAIPLKEAVSQAVGRGVTVTTLCLHACSAPCGACQGTLYHSQVSDPSHDNWLLIVADESTMLASDLTRPGNQTTGIITHHPALIGMAASFLRGEIASSEVLSSLDERRPYPGDQPAPAELEGSTLADSGRRAWLDRLRTRRGGR